MRTSKSNIEIVSVNQTQIVTDACKKRGRFRYGRIPAKRLCNQIINDYLKIMGDTLLQGYEWKLPKDLGILCVYKHETTTRPKVSMAETMRQGKTVLSYDPKRIGFHYSVEFESSHLENNGMAFQTAKRLRKALFKVLSSTNKEFRFKEI